MGWLFGNREKSVHIGWQEGESQLESVRRQLSGNPKVFVAGEVHDRQPGPGYFAETFDIFVAPVKPIFNSRKLSNFMHGLVEGVEPAQVDEISDMGGLGIGILYFDEKIDPLFSQRGERRTWVRVFPRANIASLVAQYQTSLNAGQIEPALENAKLDLLSHHLTSAQIDYIKRHDQLIDIGLDNRQPLLK